MFRVTVKAVLSLPACYFAKVRKIMKLRRRHFLALGAASAGGVLLSRWVIGQNQHSQAVVLSPDLYKSKDGLLELDLEAGNHALIVGEGASRAATQRQASLMAYNGQVPAPRLEAKPGDTVRIHHSKRSSCRNVLVSPSSSRERCRTSFWWVSRSLYCARRFR